MRRVAALLDAAIAAREEECLRAALAEHVFMPRLGWPGLWRLLPRRAALAGHVLASVASERAMRAQVAASQCPADHAAALAEHKAMVAVMDGCAANDPQAFTAPDLLALRKGCRVVEGASASLRATAASPLVTDVRGALEEHKAMVATMDSCRTLDPDCFTEDEFVGLRGGRRVVEGLELGARSASAAPAPLDAAVAMAEYRSLAEAVAACRALPGGGAAAFSATDLAALVRGERLEPCCEATAAKDKLSSFAEFEALAEFMKPYIDAAGDTAGAPFSLPACVHADTVVRLHAAAASMRAGRDGCVAGAEGWDHRLLVESLAAVAALTAEWGAFVEPEVIATAEACVARIEKEIAVAAVLNAAVDGSDGCEAASGEPGAVACRSPAGGVLEISVGEANELGMRTSNGKAALARGGLGRAGGAALRGLGKYKALMLVRNLTSFLSVSLGPAHLHTRAAQASGCSRCAWLSRRPLPAERRRQTRPGERSGRSSTPGPSHLSSRHPLTRRRSSGRTW